MVTTRIAPHRRLLGDDRGAIMVIGVFMSAFLVGALWYIIGIGDAAVYREYMQDGADAIAFSSAVYHARGMNIIALLNLIMAAVLMILVAVKIGQLLLIAANIAACLLGAFLNPFCDLLSAAEAPYENFVMRVETAVDKALRALYIAENAVAIAMPLAAEVKAVVVAGEYKKTVHGGLMVSTSLIPRKITESLSGIGKGKGATKGNGKPAVLQWVPALPVEDDDFKVLCGKAGRDVVEVVFLPFDVIGLGSIVSPIKSFAGDLIEGLVKAVPGYFCGSIEDAGKQIADMVGSSGGNDKVDPAKQCADRKEAADAEDEKRAKKKPPEPPIKFDEAKCKRQVADAMGKLTSGKKGGGSLGDGKTSKKVYEPAENGNDYLAVWGFDWGNLKTQTDAEKGVNIAGWGKAKAGDPGPLSKFQIAKAEFYYEPKSEGGKWGSLKEDAMWNMRWRARLRRMRLPDTGLGSMLADKIGDKIGGVPFIGSILTGKVEELGDEVDEKIREALGPFGDGIIH